MFETKNIVFIIVFLAASGFLVRSCYRLISYLKIAKKENRFDNIGERIKNVLTIAFAQTKLMRDPVPGIMHLLIFW